VKTEAEQASETYYFIKNFTMDGKAKEKKNYFRMPFCFVKFGTTRPGVVKSSGQR